MPIIAFKLPTQRPNNSTLALFTACVLLLLTIIQNRPTTYYVDKYTTDNQHFKFRVCAKVHKWHTMTVCPKDGYDNYNDAEVQLYVIQGRVNNQSFVSRWSSLY